MVEIKVPPKPVCICGELLDLSQIPNKSYEELYQEFRKKAYPSGP